jgi:hypothetical protein
MIADGTVVIFEGQYDGFPEPGIGQEAFLSELSSPFQTSRAGRGWVNCRGAIQKKGRIKT